MRKKGDKNEILYSLGSTLRQLRMGKGFKSAEIFSYENDLNRTAYWRWENGENITMKNFLKLCEIHNISPKEVFEIVELKKNSNQKQLMFNEPGSVIFKKKHSK
jgi:transcriptional regulator with XRE-family HTH domain